MSADERGVHQSLNGTRAEGTRDDLRASPFFAEQTREQIRRANRATMANGEAQMRDTGPEFIVQASHGARQRFAICGDDLVAQSRASAGEAA